MNVKLNYRTVSNENMEEKLSSAYVDQNTNIYIFLVLIKLLITFLFA